MFEIKYIALWPCEKLITGLQSTDLQELKCLDSTLKVLSRDGIRVT